MAVHAHPDDEASSTGGVLARYASEGIETVLVVCTNGELGDGPGGSKPGEAGHDESVVVATRRRELEESCRLLNVRHLEMLGYHDSGMMGWPSNERPDCFWQTPVEHAASRLAALIDKYRPDVIVTYDERGFYGHPDHIQANRITLSAMTMAPVAEKLYYPAVPKSGLARFAEAMRESGAEMPEQDDEADNGFDFGVEDDVITTTIDCTPFVHTKFDALGAHKSQSDSTFFLGLGRERFASMFATEFFVRVFDRTSAALPEQDLFTGLR
jgi:LmbE family N-acetylglucosaminyl deacetylase